MNINVYENAVQLGERAAQLCTGILSKAIQVRGKARMVLSTGASQLILLEELAVSPIDWSKVEIFQLSEYIGLKEHDPISFRHYLIHRFMQKVPYASAFYINGDADRIEQTLAQLTQEIRREPVDLALIEIGDNANIAFNDPPADFTTRDAYHVVNFDLSSKQQQVGEGWFANVNEVPDQAITMTIYQIMQSRNIVTCEPSEAKANAVMATIENDVHPMIPSSILKTHPNWHLFLDKESASESSIA